MKNYNFNEAKKEWSRVPWDDFGYLDSNDIININDAQFSSLLELVINRRFDPGKWRNRNETLTDFMQLDRWDGKRVLDFGCGYGPDSVRFALSGARINPADINPATLFVCNRSLGCVGKWVESFVLVQPNDPYFNLNDIDLFWSMGVLHHIPYAQDILRFACSRLSPDGECRIVVCSDKCWVEYMQDPPPEKTWEHPRFQEFVRKSDSVGLWSDWYDQKKIETMVKDFAKVTDCRYLCDDKMIGAVLVPLSR